MQMSHGADTAQLQECKQNRYRMVMYHKKWEKAFHRIQIIEPKVRLLLLFLRRWYSKCLASLFTSPFPRAITQTTGRYV